MTDKKNRNIVLLGQDGPSTRMIYHSLKEKYSNLKVIFEEPVSRSVIIQKRIKRIGLWKVVGQVLFMILLLPLLKLKSQRRIYSILEDNGLNVDPIGSDFQKVNSVNSEEAIRKIKELLPLVVIVSGTRIIKKKVLKEVSAEFINIHSGITPLYRGVHGAYWAVADGRHDLVGTTIHYIDEGIDTGAVIGQKTFAIDRVDNFATYPYLHTVAGLPMLLESIKCINSGDMPSIRTPLIDESRLRYHPTIWFYVGKYLKNGVK